MTTALKRRRAVKRFFLERPGRLVSPLALAVLLGLCWLMGGSVRTVTVLDEGVKALELPFSWATTEYLLQMADVQLYEEDFCKLQPRQADAQTLRVDRAVDVTVLVDGRQMTERAIGESIGEILTDLDILLSETDEVTPAVEIIPETDTTVTVRRVTYQKRIEECVVPMETQYIQTSLYVRNQELQTTEQNGQDGKQTVEITERWVDGAYESSTETVLEVEQEMVPEMIKVYGEGVPVSTLEGPAIVDGVPETYTEMYTGRATGYSAGPAAPGASGLGLHYGSVAVDPSLIPYGTKLYIASTDGHFVYGYAIAADTGTAMMEGHALVDLFYETYNESVLNAVWQVNVYVIPDGL